MRMRPAPIYQDPTKYNVSRIPCYVLQNLISHAPLHHHDYAELSLVVFGEGTETINGRSHSMRRGVMTFLLPHQYHEIRTESMKKVHLFCCMFDMSILLSSPIEMMLMNDLLKIGQTPPYYCELDEPTTLRMELIMTSIKQEFEHGGYVREIMMKSKLLEALAVMMRVKKSVNPEIPLANTSHKPKPWNVIQYVHENYNEPLKLNDLAVMLHKSPSSISKWFKQQTGQTFTEYIHVLRVNRAESLLISTGMSITDIALEVGFQSFRTFARAFKQLKKMSPKSYREKHGNDQLAC